MIVMEEASENGEGSSRWALSTAPAQTHPGPTLPLTQTLTQTDRQEGCGPESLKTVRFRLMTRRAILLAIKNRDEVTK
jgi:hypothetical protein